MFWVGYLNFGGIRRAEVGERRGRQEDGRRERETCLLFLKKFELLYLHSKTCTTGCGNTTFHNGQAKEVTVI